MSSSSPGSKIRVALRPANRPVLAGWRSRLPGLTARLMDHDRPSLPVEVTMPLSLERVLFLLRWLVIGLALAIQLYTASGAGGIQGVARAFQITSLVAIYNSALLVLRSYKTDRQTRIWLAVVDAAIITTLIGLAGGIYSPFLFLLYLIIVEASLLFTPSGVLTYTAVVAMLYATSAMLLPGQKWDELSITIVLSVVLGMFIWASVCGAINKAFEQERALVRREQELTAELNRQVVALSSLNRLSERLKASLDIDELMQSTVEALPDALAVDACVAMLASQVPGEGWTLGTVWYGVDEDFEPQQPDYTGLDEAERANWRHLGPLLVRQSDLEAVFEQGLVFRTPVEKSEPAPGETGYNASVLMMPLGADEDNRGLLALVRHDGPGFTQSDQEILAALARQLSLVTNNARLYEMERRNVARLQELEEMKSDFLSAVSHELRTPLTSIKASTILMLSQSATRAVDSETSLRLLRNIDRNTERLNALVTDLLDMTKLQNGRVKLAQQPVNLADVVADVVATMRPLTDGKNQSLELSIAPQVRPAYADRRRVEQVLNNLLSNAHRYTPRGGKIKLMVEESEGKELLVSIEDNGPGIAPHEQELVFERFYRGQTGKGGTGLGLSIARSLVELHGGRLWVRSQPGQGSTFYFTLPPAGAVPGPVPLPGLSLLSR